MDYGFVYCWTDHKTSKIYVGSHKGTTDDGYICSSKYMLQEYGKRPEDFTRQIVAEGRLEDIRRLETKILQSASAKLCEDFYNLHQNDGLYFDGWKKGEMSKEHRDKLSQAAKRRVRSEEHIRALHNGRRNSKNSEAHKNALSLAKKGIPMSDEQKRKLSETRLLNPNRFELASRAGKASAEKRKANPNFSKEHSERMKLSWARRKEKEGFVNGD